MCLHVASLELGVPEVEGMSVQAKHRHFAETVHIELAHKGRKAFVPEEVRQHLLLHFSHTLDGYFIVSVPAEILLILRLLVLGSKYL